MSTARGERPSVQRAATPCTSQEAGAGASPVTTPGECHRTASSTTALHICWPNATPRPPCLLVLRPATSHLQCPPCCRLILARFNHCSINAPGPAPGQLSTRAGVLQPFAMALGTALQQKAALCLSAHRPAAPGPSSACALLVRSFPPARVSPIVDCGRAPCHGPRSAHDIAQGG
mgnify:CR=1 FL=1